MLIALPDGAEFVGALFGTLRIGAVVVMVNPGRSPQDLAVLFDTSRAGCVVVDAAVLIAAGVRSAAGCKVATDGRPRRLCRRTRSGACR